MEGPRPGARQFRRLPYPRLIFLCGPAAWVPAVGGCPRSGDSRAQSLSHPGSLALFNSPTPDRLPEGWQWVRSAPLAGALSLRGARWGDSAIPTKEAMAGRGQEASGACAALSDDFFFFFAGSLCKEFESPQITIPTAQSHVIPRKQSHAEPLELGPQGRPHRHQLWSPSRYLAQPTHSG